MAAQVISEQDYSLIRVDYKYRPLKLLHTQIFEKKEDALIREKELKGQKVVNGFGMS